MTNWTTVCQHYILAKNLDSFCLCLENLSGAKLEHIGLICLANELQGSMPFSPRHGYCLLLLFMGWGKGVRGQEREGVREKA